MGKCGIELKLKVRSVSAKFRIFHRLAQEIYARKLL